MTDYDFSSLNDKEFENFVIDLLSQSRGKVFERFKEGKDQGIDGRFFNNGSSEIIQCKHYVKTKWAGLLSSLKKENSSGKNEIDKVHTLNPSRYIFVTSLSLSAHNKKELSNLFYPYILCDNDILGREDLNVMLTKCSNIETKYYKLWLTSSNVMQRFLNSDIENSSDSLREEIKEKSKFYVVTENHNQALKRLDNKNVIIVSGEPGIGKTTLARHLALWFIERGFKFYNIDNINSAFKVFNKEEKQLFYYDDFLGANYLKAIDSTKESEIVRFINIVKRDTNKKFILTSRTNILNKGYNYSDVIKSGNLRNNEFLLEIESLSDINKANILYNHIWHSGLSSEFINELYINKRYKEVIFHRNFSPRLIEFITDIEKIEYEHIQPSSFWNYILNKLENPQDIWKGTFDSESTEYVRSLVFLTVFNGKKIEEEKLKSVYIDYIQSLNIYRDPNTSDTFDDNILIAVKYFLNRTLIGSHVTYDLFNPSIADFVFNKYKNEKKILEHIFLSLNTLSSFDTLNNLARSELISKKNYLEIISLLFNKNLKINNFDLAIEVLALNVSNIDEVIKNETSKWIQLLDHINFSKKYSDNAMKLLIQGVKSNNYKLNLKDFVLNLVCEDRESYLTLAKLYCALGQTSDLLEKKMKASEEECGYYLADILYDELNELAYSIEIPDFLFMNEDGLPDYNVDGVKEELEILLQSIFPKEYLDLYNINVSQIIDEIDVYSLETKYYKRTENYYNGDSVSNNLGSDIDDLFHRSDY